MPEPTPADALERMRRQVRAVRWRRNLHELQRALYHLIAGLGGAMAALVLLALRAGSGAFALATWALAAATLLLAGGLARALARRWLSSEQAPLWIDRRTALEGRLATVLELEGRDARCAPFFPLLVDDNARRIAAWRPERLVPEGLPSGAFAGALAAVGVFLLALLLAPWLRPSAPAVAAGGDAADRGMAIEGDRAIARRVRARAGRPPATLVEPDDDDRSALSRLPAELQERIREELWGEDRERVHEAWERAERGAGPGRVSPPADRLADEREQEERWAVVRRPPPGARPARGEGGAAPTGDTPRGEGAAGRGAGEHPAERGGEAGAHQAAAGAGTGTDPHLLGEASAERAARERFDLPLAARVRALGGGAAPPSSGEAPPPAPDARPDLAAAQRRDAPVLKMRVPPGYEAAVRAVFAHPGREAPP